MKGVAVHDNDLYVRIPDLGDIASSISNLSGEFGFSFRQEVAMRVIQALASRENDEAMTPTSIVDFAFEVANLADKKDKEEQRGRYGR